jgi:hypothetical protein
MPYKSLIFVIHSYKEEGTAASNTNPNPSSSSMKDAHAGSQGCCPSIS